MLLWLQTLKLIVVFVLILPAIKESKANGGGWGRCMCGLFGRMRGTHGCTEVFEARRLGARNLGEEVHGM